MKNPYKEALIKIIKKYLKKTRKDVFRLSQDEMSEKLLVSCRSYIEIEHGNSLCNSLFLIIFLIYYCPDPMGFLEDTKRAFDDLNKK